MGASLVLTLTGPDRVGVVEQVAEAILGLQGNVENSRMARLGGEFAVIMLVSLPAEKVALVEDAFAGLTDQGYRLSTGTTEATADPYEAWPRYRVEVTGADHEGIVREIARGLSRQGITIESAETSTASAPTTGQPLFAMTAAVRVPPGLAESEWMDDLAQAGADANVDIEVALAE
jgi:glycine cleavage system transcriptional repressor